MMKKNGTHSQPSVPKKGHDNQRDRRRAASSQEEFVSLRQAVERGEEPLQNTAQEQDPAALRAERIRQLKEQVENGSYKPNLHKVAQIILYDDTDALLGS